MGTIHQDFPAFLTELRDKVDKLERRPSPTSAADLLGPGAASLAIEISDWSEPIACFNGNYYTLPGASNTPNPVLPWTGSVIAKNNGSGMQQVWNTDDLDNVRYFMRTYTIDATLQGHIFSEWKRFATPSGYVEFGDIDPAYTTSIQDQLDEMAGEIDTIPPPPQVYRQNTEPTNPDSVGRALVIMDQWFDTDDDNHPYLFDGTDWVDYADYVLGDLEAMVLAAQSTADDALNYVTAPLIQTSPLAGTGVKMVSGGIVGYAPDHSVSFILDAANGNVTMTGDVAAININGAVVTGGLLETDAAAATGIKIDNAGFVAYDGSGSPTITIDAATGAIVLLGSLTGGGTITGPVFQTSASPSKRIVIDGPNDVIKWYSAVASEFPGSLDPGTLAGVPEVTLASGGIAGTAAYSASLMLVGGGITSTVAQILCGEFIVGNPANSYGLEIDFSTGHTQVTGHMDVSGSGWVGLTLGNCSDVLFGWYAAQAKRVGNTIRLRGLVIVGSGGIAAAGTIATIPSSVFSGVLGGISSNPATILDTTGEVLGAGRIDFNPSRIISTLTPLSAGQYVCFDNLIVDII